MKPTKKKSKAANSGFKSKINILLIRMRLFIHLIPNPILYLTAVSLLLIVIFDIFEVRLPITSIHADTINFFWFTTFYAIFTSGVFFIIVFGTLDYRRANIVAPFVIARVRELIGHIKGSLYSLCNAKGIQYELGEYPSIEIFEAIARINFNELSNEGRGRLVEGQGVQFDVRFTWYQAFASKSEAILKLCDNAIADLNSLNMADSQLLEQLYHIKTSPFLRTMLENSPAFRSFPVFAIHTDMYYDLMMSGFKLEKFVDKYYRTTNVKRLSTPGESIHNIIMDNLTPINPQ